MSLQNRFLNFLFLLSELLRWLKFIRVYSVDLLYVEHSITINFLQALSEQQDFFVNKIFGDLAHSMYLSINITVDTQTVVKVSLRANKLLIEFTESIF